MALACPVTLTQGATDLIAALQGAIETAKALLGRPLIEAASIPSPLPAHQQRRRSLDPDAEYEYRWCHDIPSGLDLADHVAAFTADYNTIRPHLTLDQKPPFDTYRQARTPHPNPPTTEKES